MLTIRFDRYEAAIAFASMAEGMWENKRDDRMGYMPSSLVEFQLWDTFLHDLNAAITNAAPLSQDFTIILDGKYRQLVEDVRDNCADNCDDLEDEDACRPDEVTITGD
jgi:hypothetical protein